jgi:hypothetical protein
MPNLKIARLGPLFAASLIAAACAGPAAAGNEAAQTRATANFNKVQLDGYFEADIRSGESRTSVVLSGDPSILTRITTDVRDGTLFVGMKSGTNNVNTPTRVAISLPALRALSNAGAGLVNITGLGGEDIAIANDGAAAIRAAGRASRESLTLDGVGKIDASGVDARDVSADNNGVGRITLRASGRLTMSVNGVGEIRYTGNPASVQSQVNGLGRISRF